MHYLHLLILIATLASQRIVRRIIRHESPIDVSTLDADVIGWINIMSTCHDHSIITSYAKATF